MSHKHEDIYTNARFAGLVERYHTWPITRGQSTGEHTWQVMRIWSQVFGPMTSEESTYVLWHDAGELKTGDLPGMIKLEAPELKPVLDRIEVEAVYDMGGDLDPAVDPGIKLRLKACDLLDVLEYGSVEVLQGNKLAAPIAKWAADQLNLLHGRLSRPDFEAVTHYQKRFEEWCKL